jgi:hypothetical protein
VDALDDDIKGLLFGGTCCTSAMVRLALDEMGHENEEFVEKVTPLCRGLWSGGTCGALLGGLLALAILNGERRVEPVTVQHFVDWFDSELGSTECAALVEDSAVARAIACPPIVAAAYRKARELASEES